MKKEHNAHKERPRNHKEDGEFPKMRMQLHPEKNTMEHKTTSKQSK